MICYYVEMEYLGGHVEDAFKAFESEAHFNEWMMQMNADGVLVTAYACDSDDTREATQEELEAF